MSNLESSKEILKLIGMPDRQTVDLPALTLLAMASLKENSLWSEAESKWIRIHDIIQFVNSNYNVSYAENSRETFRKQAIHHFRIAGIIEDNGKATNSPNYKYRLTAEFLNLIQTFGTNEWKSQLKEFLQNHETLISKYESKRQLKKFQLKSMMLYLNFLLGFIMNCRRLLLKNLPLDLLKVQRYYMLEIRLIKALY